MKIRPSFTRSQEVIMMNFKGVFKVSAVVKYFLFEEGVILDVSLKIPKVMIHIAY